MKKSYFDPKFNFILLKSHAGKNIIQSFRKIENFSDSSNECVLIGPLTNNENLS
jgi:hypothetical protein